MPYLSFFGGKTAEYAEKRQPVGLPFFAAAPPIDSARRPRISAFQTGRRVVQCLSENNGEGEKTVFSRAYLEITNVCNLACSFCPGTAREKRFMDTETFALLAGKLRPYTDFLYLHVMGEPLLHPDLPEILHICSEFGYRVCLTTNGTLLAERVPLLLENASIHKVSVSLHSFEGNGKSSGLEDYVESAAGACRTLAGRGVICALRLWNQGGADAENARILQILDFMMKKQIEDLPTDPRGNRRLAENLYLEQGERFDWPDPRGTARDTQFCYGLRRQIAVLCDGTVTPCCLDSEGRLALGSLLTQELADILAAPRAQAIRRGFDARQPAEALCRRCGYAVRFNR